MSLKQNMFLDSDFIGLQQQLDRENTIKLADVAHKIERVAFDVVRFRDDDLGQLWRVEQTDEGDVLVAMYDDDKDIEITASVSDWKAIPDKSEQYVNIFYKNEAISNFKTASVGLDSEDVHIVCSVMRQKLAEDKDFQSKFIESLPKKEQEVLVAKYPELLGDK